MFGAFKQIKDLKNDLVPVAVMLEISACVTSAPGLITVFPTRALFAVKSWGKARRAKARNARFWGSD